MGNSKVVKVLLEIPVSTQFKFGWVVIDRFWLAMEEPVASSPFAIIIAVYVHAEVEGGGGEVFELSTLWECREFAQHDILFVE